MPVVTMLNQKYDLVLIDCPPNLHLCRWAALAKSDFLIVPLQAEDYGSPRRVSSRFRSRSTSSFQW